MVLTRIWKTIAIRMNSTSTESSRAAPRREALAEAVWGLKSFIGVVYDKAPVPFPPREKPWAKVRNGGERLR
jgi:hypothetical protein